MIQLGLRRAAQLFRNNPQPWHAIHVAGTNGKGTVCTYLSALLHAHGVKCGRFTSPHLIDRWDCITVNEKPVSESLFRKVENEVLSRNQDEKIGATEFELLTATAFDIFTRENVEVGVVEVGMGGRDDATNVLKSKALTILTRMGLDHQKLLGDTIEEITRHKCGIFMKDVPISMSSMNEQSVIDVAKEEGQKAEAGAFFLSPTQMPVLSFGSFATSIKYRKPQRLAIAQAYHAFQHIYGQVLKPDGGLAELRTLSMRKKAREVIIATANNHPGRMQYLDLKGLFPGRTSHEEGRRILIDGAHNLQAAGQLGLAVYRELRDSRDETQITWVIAATQGRDLQAFLRELLNKGDGVVAVEFGPVDGMPWVQPQPTGEVVKQAQEAQPMLASIEAAGDVKKALELAIESKNHIVIAGSLYLAGDVYRLLRDAPGTDGYSQKIPKMLNAGGPKYKTR